MKVLVAKNTRLSGEEFAGLVFRWGTRGAFERRYSDNMPSPEYFLASFFGFTARVCYFDIDDRDCTDYYFFVWGLSAEDDPVVDRMMLRVQQWLGEAGFETVWDDI